MATLQEMQKAAEEINKVLGLVDHPIDTSQSATKLQNELYDIAVHEVEPNDNLTIPTWDLIEALAGKKIRANASGKKKDKQPRKKKYCRDYSYWDVLLENKEGLERDDYIRKANEKYVENGGRDNLKQADFVFRYVTPLLIFCKLIEVEDNRYRISKAYREHYKI